MTPLFYRVPLEQTLITVAREIELEDKVFTSGGSEANNHALKGVFFASGRTDAHIITTQVEHPAVINPCRFLERLGARVTYLPVDGFGCVDPEDVRRALQPGTLLISVMHANNEVGTIQPIEEIARIAKEAGVLLHSDAAQSLGKIAVTVNGLGVDLLSIAGHKLYAPKGVGALFIREGVSIEPLIHGASHESGRRAGTENVGLDVRWERRATWPERGAARPRFGAFELPPLPRGTRLRLDLPQLSTE